MGRIVKGRRMRNEVPTMVGSTVQSSQQQPVIRQTCFISQRHFVSLSEMENITISIVNQKTYWERKEKLRNKIQVKFADLTEGLIIFYAQCDSFQRGKITRDEGI